MDDAVYEFALQKFVADTLGFDPARGFPLVIFSTFGTFQQEVLKPNNIVDNIILSLWEGHPIVILCDSENLPIASMIGKALDDDIVETVGFVLVFDTRNSLTSSLILQWDGKYWKAETLGDEYPITGIRSHTQPSTVLVELAGDYPTKQVDLLDFETDSAFTQAA